MAQWAVSLKHKHIGATTDYVLTLTLKVITTVAHIHSSPAVDHRSYSVSKPGSKLQSTTIGCNHELKFGDR